MTSRPNTLALTELDVEMITVVFSLYDSTGLIHGCTSSHHDLEVHPPRDQVQSVALISSKISGA